MLITEQVNISSIWPLVNQNFVFIIILYFFIQASPWLIVCKDQFLAQEKEFFP